MVAAYILISSSQLKCQNSVVPEVVRSARAPTKSISQSKPVLRQEWYLERRRNADGSIPNIDRKNAQALKNVRRTNVEQGRSPHGAWHFLGPNTTVQKNNQGRVNSIDIHPTNDDVIYLCTPNGGIWHSTTGGFSWSPITDHLGLLSFADLEISATNPVVIYAVSGDGEPLIEADGNHGQNEVESAGIFKSSDSGDTWHRTAYEFTESIIPYKLVMHPTNSNIQLLAAKSGLYRTTDGWQSSVEKVLSIAMYDVEFHPTDPSILYCSGSKTMYTSDSTGEEWSIIADPDFDFTDAARIELAVSIDNPDYVAALACTNSGDDVLLYTSNTTGANNSWTLKDNSSNLIGSYVGYCIALAIDPSDYKTFYSGGIKTFKSTNEGLSGSWVQVGGGTVHADVHDIAIRGNRIYVASDGGLSRSVDQGATWVDLSSGLHISEIYRMAGSESQNELFLLGTQDNGTMRRQLGTTFERVEFGDGMVCHIDYTNPDKMYASRERMTHILRSVNGGDNWNSVELPSGQGAWITPIIMDPFTPSTLFVGKDSIYRSSDSGSSWEYVGSPNGVNLNVLAQGISNRDRMYASQGSSLYRSDNALVSPGSNVNWISVGSTLPDIFITDIAVDPGNSLRVFITMGGYTGGQKVYRSVDGGTSWTNISASLPNVPALSLAIHNDGNNLDKMYVGTDIGIFYTDNNRSDWVYYSNDLPAVAVEDIVINTNNSTITAATYGRGLWRSDLISPCTDNKYFSDGVTHTGQYQFSYNSTIVSLAKLSDQSGTNITYSAGSWIHLAPGFLAPAKSVFRARIGGCE